MVKNPPSNAREAGSIPGQGTKIPHAVGQLSPCTAAREACALQRRPAQPKKILFLSQLRLTISLWHNVHGLPSVYSVLFHCTDVCIFLLWAKLLVKSSLEELSLNPSYIACECLKWQKKKKVTKKGKINKRTTEKNESKAELATLQSDKVKAG